MAPRLRLSFSRRFIVAGATAAAAGQWALRRGAGAQTDQLVARCGFDNQATHPAAIQATQMFAELERETDGAMKVQFFPNSALGSQTAMIAQMRLGALEFMFGVGGTLSSIKTLCGIETIAFAFKTSADAWRTFDGPLGKRIQRELGTLNIYCFENMWDGGVLQMTTSTKPVRTPDDLVGMKVRTPNAKVMTDMYSTLGAVPTVIELRDTYVALQTHIVDGMALTLSGMEAGRYYEVQKYLSLTGHSYAGYWLLANGDVWKKLSQKNRDAMLRLAARYCTIQRTESSKFDEGIVQKLAQQGLIVNTTDPRQFRAKLGPHYARFKPQFGDAAWAELEASVGKLG